MSDYASIGGSVLNFFFGAIAFIVAIFITRAVFSIGKIVRLLETISRQLGSDQTRGDVLSNKP
jgi:hypothetical protein